MVSIISIKSNKLSGEVFVPGDKSISHRALILGACAVGKTTIENLLESEDVFATLNALKMLGVNIKKSKTFGKFMVKLISHLILVSLVFLSTFPFRIFA